MQIGVIGLGRMGANISRRLMRAGHTCVVWDANASAVQGLGREGAKGVASLKDVVQALQPPRAMWVMLPAGQDHRSRRSTNSAGCCSRATSSSMAAIPTTRTTFAAARNWRPKGIRYIDCGTSGGVWGLQRGYCLMIGGEKAAVDHLDPIFSALAPGHRHDRAHRRARGSARSACRSVAIIHAGPCGAGHFVKMIHNGIEYGMMQAMAEGFDILRNKSADKLPADERFDLNVADIAEVWRRGRVVTSWLLDLTADALAKDATLEHFSGNVEDSGEGRWTIEAAIEEAVPAEVLAASLFVRFRSRQDHTFAEKMLSAMRFGFGGHVEPSARNRMTVAVLMGVSGSGKTTIAQGARRA